MTTSSPPSISAQIFQPKRVQLVTTKKVHINLLRCTHAFGEPTKSETPREVEFPRGFCALTMYDDGGH